MTNQSDEKEKVPESKNQHDGNAAEQDSGGGGGSSGISFIWAKNVAYIVRRPSTVCATLDRLWCPSASEPWRIGSSQKWDENGGGGGGVSGNKSWMGPAAGPSLDVQPRTANERSSVYAAHSCACFSPSPLSYKKN